MSFWHNFVCSNERWMVVDRKSVRDDMMSGAQNRAQNRQNIERRIEMVRSGYCKRVRYSKE